MQNCKAEKWLDTSHFYLQEASHFETALETASPTEHWLLFAAVHACEWEQTEWIRKFTKTFHKSSSLSQLDELLE